MTRSRPVRKLERKLWNGDLIRFGFDPQVGCEKAKRRPALGPTDIRYNRASGLAVVCPLTSNRVVKALVPAVEWCGSGKKEAVLFGAKISYILLERNAL